MKRKPLILLAVFALFLLAAVVAYNKLSGYSTSNIAAQEENEENDNDLTVINFTVTNEDDNNVKIHDMLGKPMIINFWASWCPPCKSEMPYFEDAFNEHGEDIHFMMIDLTDGDRETVESGKKFIEDSGYTFPVYYDTLLEGVYAYRVYSIPFTLFIDKDGTIITWASGALSRETLDKGIGLIS